VDYFHRQQLTRVPVAQFPFDGIVIDFVGIVCNALAAHRHC